MRYALMRSLDINNGPGICASLYVQGCSHHCDGCFNPDTWDFNGGMIWNRRTELQFIEVCKDEHVKNICILGGEPLDQGKDMLRLIKNLKEVKKPIWLWTGYTWEEILKNNSENEKIRFQVVEEVDVLVDGRFVKSLKDESLRFKGSSNQRVIDVKKSLSTNSIVLYE